MRSNKKIAVIIPALNEELSIGKVITDIPDWVDDIIVVDNGSKDKTAIVAKQKGARVFLQEQRSRSFAGYSCR